MKLQSINPATENLIKEYEGIDFNEAAARGVKCKEAQENWSALDIKKRCAHIKKLARILRTGPDKYARLITEEMGKPVAQSRAEVEKCAWLCEYYADTAPKLLQEENIKTEAKKSFVRFDPLGVLLAIMPWNFPFWQVLRASVPALAAGNGVLLKHASNVPGCSIAIGEIFKEAGFPDGIFSALLIDSKTAMRLIEEDCVDCVTLTGSTAAGAEVGRAAGGALKKCVLELGGSDPYIVLKDADIHLACKTALTARMINAGQSCIAAKRFIVERSVAKKFTEILRAQFAAQKIGDPMDSATAVGPLAKKEFVSALDAQVKDAIKKGAAVLAGGKPAKVNGKGFFYEPTLLINVTKEMAVYKEETFGPLMAIFIAKNEEDALNMARDSDYGLGASIWTADTARAESLAGRIEAGFVSINGMVKSDPRLPFGGIKRSGFGRELGSYGIKEFVNIKAVMVQ